MGIKECFVTWTLISLAIFIVSIATDDDSFRANEESPMLRKTNGEITEILKDLEEPDQSIGQQESLHKNDHYESEPSHHNQNENMTPRIRKTGTSRPKYDPGLKWIGLGKRPSSSAPLGPELFTDLRRFFDAAQKELWRRQEMRSIENLGPFGPPHEGGTTTFSKQDRRDGQELKFVTRSKSSEDGGQRKHYYNPSILWTGLGR